MKKSILIIAIALISAASFAQSVRTEKQARPYLENMKKLDAKSAASYVKSDTAELAKAYKADPNRIYLVAMKFNDLLFLSQTSQAGFIPYLKAVNLPLGKLDDAQAYHNSLLIMLAGQYRQQYVADSLKAVKAKR